MSNLDSVRKYQASARGAAVLRAYRASPEWREMRRRNIEKSREGLADRQKRYRSTPEYIAHRRKYRESPKGRAAAFRHHLKRSYGMTAQQYEKLLLGQAGVCAICGGTNLNGARLHVDHDHVTGRVRGLLCFSCNKILGLAGDNILRLYKSVDYLDFHRGRK